MTTAVATDVGQEIKTLEEELLKTKQKLVELRRARSGEVVEDFELTRGDGSKVRISELFGNSDDLILVHNMGKSCAYCTLWADGFIGVYQHLENRAGFALVSADKHTVMKDFTEGRGWKFTCVSGADSEFTGKMGFLSDKGEPWPGVSSFKKNEDGKITRVSHTWFGPGDDFCATWHLLDLLADGANKWEPKYSY